MYDLSIQPKSFVSYSIDLTIIIIGIDTIQIWMYRLSIQLLILVYSAPTSLFQKSPFGNL